MKSLTKLFIFLLLTVLLTGCGDLKNAISGIDSAAKTAAKATSTDVHAIRAITLTENGRSFTVEELFTGILKDVFWQYKETEEANTLQIKGTWKEPLFESYAFDDNLKQKLAEDGDIFVKLTIHNHKIVQESTSVQLVYNKKILVDESGIDAFEYLLKTYTENH